MDSDKLNIPDLHKALQEIFRLGQENMQLQHDKLDAEMRHMHAEYQLKLTQDLLAKLKEMHFGTTVQEVAHVN
jgi:hypothetical protein